MVETVGTSTDEPPRGRPALAGSAVHNSCRDQGADRQARWLVHSAKTQSVVVKQIKAGVARLPVAT